MAKPAIELIETRQGCEICETTKRFNVMLNGVKVEQLWWNMKGYVGNLPLPDGSSLYMPEGSLASFKREISILNREFAEAAKTPAK